MLHMCVTGHSSVMPYRLGRRVTDPALALDIYASRPKVFASSIVRTSDHTHHANLFNYMCVIDGVLVEKQTVTYCYAACFELALCVDNCLLLI